MSVFGVFVGIFQVGSVFVVGVYKYRDTGSVFGISTHTPGSNSLLADLT